MIFLWLPYLSVQWKHGEAQSLALGKAEVLDDSDEVWNTRMGRKRPEYMTIFRTLPYTWEGRDGDPIYGTLVRSDDPDWLQRYMEEIAAVLHWLADDGRQSIAAEQFACYGLSVPGDASDPSQNVTLYSKYVRAMESAKYFRVFPPLSIRGMDRARRLHVDRADASALLALMAHDPQDRRIVAVRQYFRTHFNDQLFGSFAHDCATHCAAIEAAMGIDTRSDGQRRFVNALCSRYGDDPERRAFFNGAYVSRSLYVHGYDRRAVNDADTGDSGHVASLTAFERVRWRARILKALSREAIAQSLAPVEKPPVVETSNSARTLLAKAIESGEVWASARSLLTRDKAAARLVDMNSEEFRAIEDLLNALESRFDWSCVREAVRDKIVCDALRTCALFVSKSTEATPSIKSVAAELGAAAAANDRNALEKWSWSNGDGWNLPDVPLISRVWTVYRIACLLAQSFDSTREHRA